MKIAEKKIRTKSAKKIAKTFLIFLFLFHFSSCTCSFLLFSLGKRVSFNSAHFLIQWPVCTDDSFYTSQVVRLSYSFLSDDQCHAFAKVSIQPERLCASFFCVHKTVVVYIFLFIPFAACSIHHTNIFFV